MDAGALSGIAVTAVDNSNGTWQYSTNGGTTWNAFGSPTDASARLLAADANTYVRFVPNANWNGTVAAGITFRAWDQSSGAAGNAADASTNGGTSAFSSATASAAITVNAVNDAPVGTNNTVTMLEDGTYTFAAVDFGFSDPNDIPANALIAVQITTLPSAGSLTDNGVAVSAGQIVTLADISGGQAGVHPGSQCQRGGLRQLHLPGARRRRHGQRRSGPGCHPAHDERERDLGQRCTAGHEQHRDHQGGHRLYLRCGRLWLQRSQRHPGQQSARGHITTLPGAGQLTNNGIAVAAGSDFTLADITGGLLVFTPAADANGAGYASFTFQVQDNGGTANGGVDVDVTPRTMTIDVTSSTMHRWARTTP